MAPSTPPNADPDPAQTPEGGVDIPARKRDLRVLARRNRARLSPRTREAAACSVRDLLLARLPVGQGSAVGGYWAMGNELDLSPTLTALAARGQRCALPSVVGRDAPLEFREWMPGDRLVRAGFGTSEPEPDRPVLRPAILLVPLLAFDTRGCRLGYGGGFYDRTLAALRDAAGRVFAIGVAFAAQEMEEVPVECFDQPLDAVATEGGIRIFKRGAS